MYKHLSRFKNNPTLFCVSAVVATLLLSVPVSMNWGRKATELSLLGAGVAVCGMAVTKDETSDRVSLLQVERSMGHQYGVDEIVHRLNRVRVLQQQELQLMMGANSVQDYIGQMMGSEPTAFLEAAESDVPQDAQDDLALTQQPIAMPRNKATGTLEDALNSGVHWMIVGETGSGKSTIANALAALASTQGAVQVLDPHASPKDWQGLRVCGAGRDYEGLNAMMDRQLNEMDRRYKLRTQGKETGEIITVIADELPSLMANCELAPRWIKDLSREARKVDIRLMLLTQGTEVKALNLEGQGTVRQAFTIIRLGKAATEHARLSKNPELYAAVIDMARPAMIDDIPLMIPELDCPAIEPEVRSTEPETENDRLEALFNVNPMKPYHESIIVCCKRRGGKITARELQAAKLRALDGFKADGIKALLLELQQMDVGSLEGDVFTLFQQSQQLPTND